MAGSLRAAISASTSSRSPTYMAESMGLKSAKGAIVAEAMSGTPAADAGLKAGDVITKLNGQVVDDASDLTRRIGSFKPSDKVELTYMRDGSEKTASDHARRPEERDRRQG